MFRITLSRGLPRVLLCASLAAAAPHLALAEDSASITITATRTPIRVSDAVAEVNVIDRAALDRATGRTLAELLAQQPGLQMTSNGPGKISGVFFRGLEARHTMLLVDGVRIFSATVGTPSLDNLPLEAIERIEIVRGPMAALYGNGAVGGVIQVLTRRGSKGFSANAKLSVGSNGYAQSAGGFGLSDGSFDIAAQVQNTGTLGISATNAKVPFGSYNADRDGWRQNAGTARIGWQLREDWRVELFTLQSQARTGVDDGPGADAQARLATRSTSLALDGQVTPIWKTRLIASQASDVYDTLSSASAFATLGAIVTQQRQFAWQQTVATPLGQVLGLVDRLEEHVSRPGQPFAVSDRHIDGVALGLDGAAAGHVWQANLRRDRNSQFGGATTGALGWGWAFAPAWRVGASLGSSYVAPSFNQLYFPNFGSPTLQPEEGRHAELSLRYTVGAHSLRVAEFGNRYRGFITSGPLPVNLPRATIRGSSVSYEGSWRDWTLAASLDHADPRNDTVGNANYGLQLPRRAKDIARLAADWQGSGFSAGATLGAFASRFDDAANKTRLGGYALLDLRADWVLAPGTRLGLKINNLGDKRYETALGYNQPRREVFVTLRWSMR